jgi:hypothetical protein
MQLQTINATDLITLLTTAGSPEYTDTIFGEYNAVDCLAYEVNADMLGTNSVSTPGARTNQDRNFTTSPGPPLVEASRGPKRREMDNHDPLGVNNLPRARVRDIRHNNVKRRKGDVGMREQMLVSARASGKSGLRNPAPRSSHALKRLRLEHGVCFVASSDVKQTQGTLAQRMDLVILRATFGLGLGKK